jgi:hypothetical protein
MARRDVDALHTRIEQLETLVRALSSCARSSRALAPPAWRRDGARSVPSQPSARDRAISRVSGAAIRPLLPPRDRRRTDFGMARSAPVSKSNTHSAAPALEKAGRLGETAL